MWRSPPRLGVMGVAAALLSALALLGAGKTAYAQSTTLSTDQATYPLLAPITVTYSGMSGSALDYITIAHQGSPGTSWEQYAFTGGALSGTSVFHHIPPGTFVVRAYFDNSDTKRAESEPFTVQSPTWSTSVSTDQTMYPSLAPVTVTYSGMSGAFSDWISIARANAPDSIAEEVIFTGGALSGTAVFHHVGGPGTFVARAYFDNTDIKEAESAPFTVQAPTWATSVSTDATSYASGMVVPVNYSGVSGALSDYIAIALVGSPDATSVAWVFTGGALSGTAFFSSLAPGTYVARAYFDNTDTKDAESAPFTIVAPPTVTLSTNHSGYVLGAPVVATFSGMLGSSSDWISIAAAGSADTTYVMHQYTDGVGSGTITFNGLASGSYVARAYFSDSFTKEMESATFTVSSSQGSPLTNYARTSPLLAPASAVVATETNGNSYGAGLSATDDFPLASPIAVSPDGALTVHVPLWVPPGRNGMQPELSLDYNSRAGRGTVGYGWALSGLSTITRCVASAADNGYGSAPPVFNNADQFCLDGEPLVPETAQAVVVGKTYRTLHDSFRKIVVTQLDWAGGPAEFTAYQRDGRTLTFSARASNRLNITALAGQVGPSGVTSTPTSVTYAWVLTAVQDQSGNRMQIAWVTLSLPDGYGVEFYPAQIYYTANQTTGLTSTKTITFNYNETTDATSWPRSLTWRNGVEIAQSHLLTSITVQGPSADTSSTVTLKNYVLTYETMSSNLATSLYQRPNLTALYDCDGASVCKPPLAFDYGENLYQQPSDEWIAVDANTTNVKLMPQPSSGVWPARIYAPDLNGDGRSDLIYLPLTGQDYVVQLSNGTMAAPSLSPQLTTDFVSKLLSNPFFSISGTDNRLFPLDFDGNGTMDVFLTLDNQSSTIPCCAELVTHTVQGSSSSFFNFQPNRLPSDLVNGNVNSVSAGEVADLNGDGLPDLIETQTPLLGDNGLPNQSLSWEFRLNSGGSFAGPALQFAGPNDHLLVDIDGDGSFEVLTTLFEYDSTRYTALFPDGRHEVTTLDSNLGLNYVFADINGDGLADALSFGGPADQGSSNVDVRINSGNGFYAPNTFNVGLNVHDATKRVLDFNKDGKQDILVRPYSTTQPTAYQTQPNCPGQQLCMFVLWYDGNGLQVTTIPPTGIPLTLGNPQDPDESTMTEIMDVNGDGLDDIAMLNGGELRVYVRGKAPTKGKLLRAVTRTGAQRPYNSPSQVPGMIFNINYKPISDSAVYQPDTAKPCGYPQLCVDSKVWVVSDVTRAWNVSPLSTAGTLQYQYVGGRGDMRGRGFLGFEQVSETQVESNTITTTSYDLSPQTPWVSHYPLAGFPKQTDISVTDQLFSYSRTIVRTPAVVATTPAGIPANAFFVYAQSTNDQAQIEDNNIPGILHNVTRTESRDSLGNLVQEVVTREDGSTDQVSHVYGYLYPGQGTTFPWPEILTDTITETSSTVAAGSLSRVTQLEYDAQWRLTTRTDLPSGNDLGEQTLITTIVPTAEGLVGSISSSETAARGGGSRQVSIIYDDAEHAFPSVQIDGMGHILRRAWHPGFGVVATEEDENGLQTTSQYDGLMRLMSKSLPSGEATTYSYSTYQNDPNAPYDYAYSIMRIVELHNSGEKVIHEMDARQKPTVTRRWNRLDGRPVFTQTGYDDLDRVVAYSYPAFQPATNVPPMFQRGFLTATNIVYDNLSRVQSVQLPDGSTRSNQFYGLTTVTTDGNNHTRNAMTDGRGRLIRSLESSDGTDSLTTQYNYGPFNTLHQVTDTNGNVFQTDVNRLGQPRHQYGGDTGHRWFNFNAFGDIEKASTTEFAKTYAYDAVGRLTTEQNLSLGTPTLYRWDTADHGLGKIGSTTSPDNVTTTFAYDLNGRLSGKTWALQMPTGFQQYSIGMTYDPVGRLDMLTYPVVPGSQLSVRYTYGAGGQLQSVVDPSTLSPYWTMQNSSAAGAFTTESFRDGTTVIQTESSARPSTLGNIHVASGAGGTLFDVTYSLDGNNNIIGRTDNANNQTETFGYDRLNRLKSWTWVDGAYTQQENYQYDGLGNLNLRKVLRGVGADRRFDTNSSAVPHQITGGSAFYGYDGNGRQTSSAGRTISYTDFDLPAFIAEPSGQQVTFSYDADKQRVLKTWLTGDFTLDLGGLFEESTVAGVTTDVMSVFANGKHVAAVVNTGGKPEVLDVVGDHLGSTQLLVGGGSVEKLRYHPFGGRLTFNAPLQSSGTPASGIRAGFAEQNQDDEPGLNLIDMNGRVYDPVQARFLSPDPIVDRAYTGQSFNPYSYVWNNPLKYRDPTGLDGGIPSPGEVFPPENIYLKEYPPDVVERTPPPPSTAGVASSGPLTLAATAQPANDTGRNAAGSGGMPAASSANPFWAAGHYAAEHIHYDDAKVLDMLLAKLHAPREVRQVLLLGGSLIDPAIGGTLSVEVLAGTEAEAALTASTDAAKIAEDAVRFHHPWPKYLGGKVQQILEPLPKAIHDAFHSGLDKILPRQAGAAYYEALSPVARAEALKDLGAYVKAFDAKFGTVLYEAMLREGFPY